MIAFDRFRILQRIDTQSSRHILFISLKAEKIARKLEMHLKQSLPNIEI